MRQIIWMSLNQTVNGLQIICLISRRIEVWRTRHNTERMMTMSRTLITSDDPKGRQAVDLFRAAYNKAGLDSERAQRLNENEDGGFTDGLRELIERCSVTNRYADEEVSSSYAYPREYKGPKPIEEQIRKLAEILGLDPSLALEYAKSLPPLPEGAEGYFAIASVDALAAKHFPEVTDPTEKHCAAIRFIHTKIAASRRFYNYREGQITPAQLRAHARTAVALAKLAETQKGDILIVAAQLGMRHRGKSVRRAREVFVTNEFGLGSVAVGSVVLTHPERLVRWEELDMDCPGDEFAPGADGPFSYAPCFRCHDDGVEFNASAVSDAHECYGSTSAFLPQ